MRQKNDTKNHKNDNKNTKSRGAKRHKTRRKIEPKMMIKKGSKVCVTITEPKNQQKRNQKRP